MSFNPHRIPPPRNLLEEVEELLDRSGSSAREVIIDQQERKIARRGDYVDLLLAKKALSRARITVI